MGYRSSIIRFCIPTIFLFIIISSFNVGVIGKSLDFQFEQLDPFYQNSLFGIKFDYNSNTPSAESLQLLSDLITGEEFPIQNDLDPEIDNNITMIGHDSHEIKSAFIAVESIKRTESITPFEVEWQASLPYFKYLSVFSLPSGESVILTQDLLGLALKLDGQNFIYDQYLVGYANIPLKILEFLLDSLNSSQMVQNSIDGHTTTIDIPTFSSIIPMEVEIQENNNELTITTTYSNITYLFQTNGVNIEQISSFSISDKFVLIEFESISFTTRIMKYSTSTNSGVETQVEMNVGAIQNLIINEELPSGLTWNETTEKHIEKEYPGLIRVNDTISWYKGNDIYSRMTLFNHASLSLLVSHNLGVLEGFESKKSSSIKIDGCNTSREELIQSDITAKDNITITQNEDLLFINHIKGHDYALQRDLQTQKWSLTSINIKLVALTQHPSLSGNILFLEESSLLNPFVAESVRRFVANMSTTSLSTEQLLKTANLYLTSAEYVQDFQIESWMGYPTKIKSLSKAILKSNNLDLGLSKISYFSLFPGVFSLAILVVFRVRMRSSRT
ncbi:hypothetical protein CEE45_00715 [Candidatus Heimdallarchaeota archaeon B3_Heim]|nr:MAG: hypothetical protein CEE45_00715 [Candidatus Heimdallarchaeota archaeon B3_Heim]